MLRFRASAAPCLRGFIAHPGRLIILIATAAMLGVHAPRASAQTRQADAGGVTEYADPPVLQSEGGVLRATFIVKRSVIHIGGRAINSYTFNDLYCPPTLRVKPGDTLELTFENQSNQPTNIHFHGLTVSPLNNGDNIFVRVDPGHTFNYVINIPADHNPGLYYYHAHAHGIAERQVTYGFSGALLIDGQLDAYPELKDVADHVMVLKDIQVSPFGNVPQDVVTSRTVTRTVNGLLKPTLRIRPGETQLWRIANTGANLYYRLHLGGRKFWVIAEDGNPTLSMLPRTEYTLGPSARVEIMVQFDSPGAFVLATHKVRTGPAGDGNSAVELVKVVCEGEAVATPAALPMDRDCCARPIEDYRDDAISAKRLIVFNETDTDFRVNNRVFNENRIDTRVPLGSIEEWTVRNATDELHQFHIHQTDFQITEINGKPVEFTGHRDNFIIPVRGEVKMIIPFTNPVIVGNFVYHCHIMEHEDGGMMATIQVFDPANPDGVPPPSEHVVSPPADANARGGPIHLTDDRGRPWRGEDARADLLLVSFGYSHCNGACPRTVGLLHDTLNALGAERDRVQPVMVSIDPQRDDVARLREYVEESNGGFIALTGDARQIAQVAGEFGVAYQRQPAKADGSYGLSHSTNLYLTTRDGRVLARFELTDAAERIADEARAKLALMNVKDDATTVTAAAGVVDATNSKGGL